MSKNQNTDGTPPANSEVVRDKPEQRFSMLPIGKRQLPVRLVFDLKLSNHAMIFSSTTSAQTMYLKL